VRLPPESHQAEVHAEYQALFQREGSARTGLHLAQSSVCAHGEYVCVHMC
jgi:hypothetical protein